MVLNLAPFLNVRGFFKFQKIFVQPLLSYFFQHPGPLGFLLVPIIIDLATKKSSISINCLRLHHLATTKSIPTRKKMKRSKYPVRKGNKILAQLNDPFIFSDSSAKAGQMVAYFTTQRGSIPCPPSWWKMVPLPTFSPRTTNRYTNPWNTKEFPQIPTPTRGQISLWYFVRICHQQTTSD